MAPERMVKLQSGLSGSAVFNVFHLVQNAFNSHIGRCEDRSAIRSRRPSTHIPARLMFEFLYRTASVATKEVIDI
jgi:hypothetical protein